MLSHRPALRFSFVALQRHLPTTTPGLLYEPALEHRKDAAQKQKQVKRFG
jgi:hypothetical protein